MADARRRLMRGAALPALAGAVALLCACASPNASSKKVPAHAGQSAAEAAEAAAASGRDWHALVIVPFGTLLKDVPFKLGEVVQFHDASSKTAVHEERDCHTLQGVSPPPFFGRPLAGYSLCFASDRLNHVEALVDLPADSATAQFAKACAEWGRRGSPEVIAADHCTVKDGGTEIDARLDAPEGPGGPTLSVMLDAAPPARDADP